MVESVGASKAVTARVEDATFEASVVEHLAAHSRNHHRRMETAEFHVVVDAQPGTAARVLADASGNRWSVLPVGAGESLS